MPCLFIFRGQKDNVMKMKKFLISISPLEAQCHPPRRVDCSVVDLDLYTETLAMSGGD